MVSKYHGSGVPPKLRTKILTQILLPNSSIPDIAKKYSLSSATLYGWRCDHKKKNISKGIIADQISSDPLSNKSNFIELLSEEELVNKSSNLAPKVTSKSKATSNLTEISLIIGGNISLSITGAINASSLIKILTALEESC